MENSDSNKPKKEENPQGEKEHKKKKSKGSAGAGIAGGAIGGAVGGAAGGLAGVAFSDEIEELFHPETSDTPPTEEDNSTVATNDADLLGSEMPGGFSEIEVSAVDTEGNVYSVSMYDLDADGMADIETAEIQLVDGSSISYLDIEGVGSYFAIEEPQFATLSDYYSAEDYPVQDTFSYTIQEGDTLSEIAEANNTSVEHLMELNPEITDPNLIYANNQLILPGDDVTSDPNQFNDSWTNNSFTVLASDESNDYSGSEEYDQVDWGSFADEPTYIDDSEYGNAFMQEDFDLYEAPDSYMDDSFFDINNDMISSEFF